MPRIRLIHWKPEECALRAESLRPLGYEIDAAPLTSSSLKEFRENPPAAVIIDLSRLPSHGLEVATFLRKNKATRFVPLIFVEGAPEKVAKAKSALPDARFTNYERVGPILEDVLENPPREVHIPASISGPDSPVPLAKKLGLKPGQPTGLLNAPKGFEAAIPRAVFERNPRGKFPLTLWFITTRAELESALPQMRQCAEDGGIWIIWPKQTKSAKPDVNGNLVRELALGAGLVDFKICAVDHTWSGMRFAVKR